MDADKPFQSKRRAVTFVSLLLLALVVSGAQIKEANTFIFKIEFANHQGLTYLLAASVVTCILRYYAYSERYRNALFLIWSSRLLADYKIYHVDYETNDVGGLLGGRLYVSGSNHDIENPSYKKEGFLKRSVGLQTSETHEFHGDIYLTEFFELDKFSKHWTSSDLRALLKAEFKYRAEAWYKYRETLDLTAPYILATTSLLALAISYWGT